MYETVYEEVCDQVQAPSVDEYGPPQAPVLDTYGSPQAAPLQQDSYGSPLAPPVQVIHGDQVKMRTKYFVIQDEYGSPAAPPVSCRQVPKQQEKEECRQVDITILSHLATLQ